jgi:hypothetical protein
MMQTAESQRIPRQTCLRANVFTINHTWNGLGLNPGVRATNRQKHGLASKDLVAGEGQSSYLTRTQWNGDAVDNQKQRKSF